MAEIQALIDLKWKENPEEMKRVMEEIKAKENEKAKVETPKQVSFDPQLTQELIKEMNKELHNIDMSKVQDLIERGADVRAKDNRGETPLHFASWYNSIEIAKFLIERGADVRAKNNGGRTPLHWASKRNHIEIAKLLLDAGSDVEAKNNNGETPLHWVKSYEMQDLLKKYQK